MTRRHLVEAGELVRNEPQGIFTGHGAKKFLFSFHNSAAPQALQRKFSTKPGRNPKTAVAAPVTARRVVTFKGSEKLKAEVDCE
jgi:hypothetical protein